MVAPNNENCQIPMKCEVCAFFQPNPQKKGAEGDCRYNPPKLLTLPGRNMAGQNVIQMQAFFPIVSAELWCGCFEPKNIP